jgi:hypothetical protein
MASAIDTIILKTDTQTNGMRLPAAGWETKFSPNPGPSYVRMTDCAGGMWQKILPKEDATTNMFWAGTCWTVNGNEIRCGPKMNSAAGTAITGTGVKHMVEEYYSEGVYFSVGTKKYFTNHENNPTEMDPGGTAVVTDMALSSADGVHKIYACLGTGAVARVFNINTWAWSAWTYRAQVLAECQGKTFWRTVCRPQGRG